MPASITKETSLVFPRSENPILDYRKKFGELIRDRLSINMSMSPDNRSLSAGGDYDLLLPALFTRQEDREKLNRLNPDERYVFLCQMFGDVPLRVAVRADFTEEGVLNCYSISAQLTDRSDVDINNGYDPDRCDSLTGVFTRVFFDTQVSEIESLPYPISIMFADVNNLKPVNDRLGHRAGDIYLSIISKIFLYSLRASDDKYRYGGDEFVFVLHHGNDDAAKAVYDRIEGVSSIINNKGQELQRYPKDKFEKYYQIAEQIMVLIEKETRGQTISEKDPTCTIDSLLSQFPIGIAIGWESASADKKDVLNLILEADYKMYKDKNFKKSFYNSQEAQEEGIYPSVDRGYRPE